MSLPGSNERARNDASRAIARSRGEVNPHLHFDYEIVIANSIPNTHKLPSEPRDGSQNLQDSSGNTFFQLNYSLLDGDHVLAP